MPAWKRSEVEDPGSRLTYLRMLRLLRLLRILRAMNVIRTGSTYLLAFFSFYRISIDTHAHASVQLCTQERESKRE